MWGGGDKEFKFSIQKMPESGGVVVKACDFQAGVGQLKPGQTS